MKWRNYTMEHDGGLAENSTRKCLRLVNKPRKSLSLKQSSYSFNILQNLNSTSPHHHSPIQLTAITLFTVSPSRCNRLKKALCITNRVRCLLFMSSWMTKLNNVASFLAQLIVLSSSCCSKDFDRRDLHVIALCYKATSVLVIIQVLTIFIPWNEVPFQAHCLYP